jgi:Arc/MetJ family transcription regulator
VADDAALAAAIRAGDLDDRYAEVAAAVRETVRDKLVVANPRYLDNPA